MPGVGLVVRVALRAMRPIGHPDSARLVRSSDWTSGLVPVLHRVAATNVLGVGDWLQVRRVDAVADAAEVVDDQPLRDRSVGEFVGNPVSALSPTLRTEFAIAMAVLVSGPQPALAHIASGRLRPKPVRERRIGIHWSLLLLGPGRLRRSGLLAVRVLSEGRPATGKVGAARSHLAGRSRWARPARDDISAAAAEVQGCPSSASAAGEATCGASPARSPRG